MTENKLYDGGLVCNENYILQPASTELQKVALETIAKLRGSLSMSHCSLHIRSRSFAHKSRIQQVVKLDAERPVQGVLSIQFRLPRESIRPETSQFAVHGTAGDQQAQTISLLEESKVRAAFNLELIT